MKKFILSLGILFTVETYSQSYIGYLNDNYSGVHNVIKNPSELADSRLKVDVNLFGASSFLSNDALGVDKDKVFDLDKDDLKFKSIEDLNRVGDLYFSTKNNLASNYDFLGPSVAFTVKDKHSFSLFTRARLFSNLNDINIEAINKIHKDTKGRSINKIESLLNYKGDSYLASNAWGEVGVSYATEMYKKEEHYLKYGLSLKYIRGVAAISINNQDLILEIDKNDKDLSKSTLRTQGHSVLGYSKNVEGSIKDFDTDNLRNFEEKANGFAADIGFTYEWRPDYVNRSENEVNKYKFKVGLSFTDIGFVNYSEGSDLTYDLARGKSKPITKEDIDTLNTFGNDPKKIYNYLFEKTSDEGKYNTGMPTAIHLSTDWNINDKFYLNLDTNFDIASKESVNIENTYVISPRFETKWFSVNLPLSIFEFSGFNAGFGLRAGPLYIGSGSIISSLFSDTFKSMDVYAGLKVPIFYSKPKDIDGDNIFGKDDKCPDEKGPKENNGCPWGDKDNDGVTDNIDKCPDTFGVKENNGCQWEDKDKDGVSDNLDKCPDVAGLKELEGCPDADNDGVADNLDKCPKVAGDKENNGCPSDMDNDGILDKDDKCPKVPGVVKENGCPEVVVITKEVVKTINSYAKSIYFNSGKSSFRIGTTQTLEMIADVIRQYPTAKFNIEGHTDSQGDAKKNKKLSEVRAKAVYDYLVKKGVRADCLTSYGFGEEYPIDTNNTRSGRASNRRVEIKLKK